MKQAMAYFKEKDNAIILNVRVIPRASKDMIQGVMGDALKVRIQTPPIEGKANAHLVKFLSKQWKIPRGSIEILSGETGRNKRLRISDPPDELRRTLRSFNS